MDNRSNRLGIIPPPSLPSAICFLLMARKVSDDSENDEALIVTQNYIC